MTVVVPVWGAHAAYLDDAISSLTQQSRPSAEILVVDNASDPPISGVPDEVRVVRSADRLRIGSARNFGLRQVRTKYVMFWDVDDRMLPGALERMWSELEQDHRVVAVTMDSVRWAPETGAGSRWPWPRSIMYSLADRPRLFACVALLYNPFTTTGPALMRTDAVVDASGFPEDIAFFEDWALSGSLAVRGRIVMLREVGRLYRVHDESLSLGHLDHPDQREWLRGMRRRARRDPRVPLWIKALLPFIWVHHRCREHRRRRPGVGGGYYESALEDMAASPKP